MSHEYAACRKLWCAALAAILTDFRLAVAKAREKDALIDANNARRGRVAEPSNLADVELRKARGYLRSSSCRTVAQLAGVGVKIDPTLRWIAGEGPDANGRRQSRKTSNPEDLA